MSESIYCHFIPSEAGVAI